MACLHDVLVGNLSWEDPEAADDSNAWGLASSGSFYTHTCGALAKMSVWTSLLLCGLRDSPAGSTTRASSISTVKLLTNSGSGLERQESLQVRPRQTQKSRGLTSLPLPIGGRGSKSTQIQGERVSAHFEECWRICRQGLELPSPPALFVPFFLQEATAE